MLTPKSPWKNKDERQKAEESAKKGAVLSGGKVKTAATKSAAFSASPSASPSSSVPTAAASAPMKLAAAKPGADDGNTASSPREPLTPAQRPFRVMRPLGPNFGTNDPKDLKTLRAATTAIGLTPPWVAGRDLDGEDEQPETFKALAGINGKAGGRKTGHFGGIVTPGGKAEGAVNKALVEAKDGPARFQRLLAGEDPKRVMADSTGGEEKELNSGGIANSTASVSIDEEKGAGNQRVEKQASLRSSVLPPSHLTKPEESGVTRDSKQALLPDESAKAEALSETPVVQKSSNSGSNSGQQKTEGDDPVAKLTDEIASLEARLRGPIDKQSENRLLRQVSRLFAMREGLRESLKGKGEQSLPQESALARIEESDDFSSTLDSQLFDASTAAGAGLKALDSELTKLSDQVLKAGADGKELRTLEHAVGALRQKKEQLLVNQLYGAKDIVPAPLEEEIRRLAMPGLGSTALSDLQYADALNAAKWLVSGEYEDSIDQLVKEKAQITSRGEGKLDLIEGLEIEIEFRRAALSAMQQLDADYSIIRSKLGYAGGSTDALEDEELGLIESRARIFSLIGGLLRTSSDPGINAWVKEMVAREPDRAMVILDGIGAPGLFNSRRNPK